MLDLLAKCMYEQSTTFNFVSKDTKMARKCNISGTGVQAGNNVSHANNRTRRRFLPNLQVVSLMSDVLGKIFKLKVCTKTLRSIEHNGGLDAYLETTSNSKLTDEAKKIKKAIAKKKGKTVSATKKETKVVKAPKARAEKKAKKLESAPKAQAKAPVAKKAAPKKAAKTEK